MRTALRYWNALIAAACLVSALLVLGTNVFDPVYRSHSQDALWFVFLYVLLHARMLQAFLWDTWEVPWFAIGKAVVALLFLVTFVPVGPWWMGWSPGRYIYQLVDWGPGAEFILFAFLFLGRGIGNTMNALILTEHWWRPWRIRQPLLSRLFSALPILVVVMCIWTFTEIVRTQWLRDLAQRVVDELDCPTVMSKLGQTTTDLRQMGKHRYHVRIEYACPVTTVLISDEPGHIGMAKGASQCCGKGT